MGLCKRGNAIVVYKRRATVGKGLTLGSSRRYRSVQAEDRRRFWHRSWFARNGTTAPEARRSRPCFLVACSCSTVCGGKACELAAQAFYRGDWIGGRLGAGAVCRCCASTSARKRLFQKRTKFLDVLELFVGRSTGLGRGGGCCPTVSGRGWVGDGVCRGWRCWRKLLSAAGGRLRVTGTCSSTVFSGRRHEVGSNTRVYC